MAGIRAIVVGFCGVAAGLAQSIYWPLNPGNIWVYRTTDRGLVTLTTQRTEAISGQIYTLLSGHPAGDAWLRADDAGAIYALNRTTGDETLWYNFGAAIGEPYGTSLPGTAGRAIVQTRNSSYSGPIGSFSTALRMVYPGVTQPGVESELFLPYVGLVHRSEIAGIVASQWDLIYASLGGVTAISQPEDSFTVSASVRRVLGITLFPPTVPNVPFVQGLEVRLTLRHTDAATLDLNFPSGQSFDVILWNEKGERAYVWSAGKNFTQSLRAERIRGERTWIVEVPLPARGRYLIDGFLTTTGGPLYRAVIPFEY